MLDINKTTESNRRIPGRSMIILIGCIILWGILIWKLFDLQIIKYEYYQKKVLDNVQRLTTLSATRGEIFDADGNKLASNYTVYRVFISPRDIKDDEQAELIASGLSEILGVDHDKIIAMTKKVKRADETVMKKATEEQADQIRSFILKNGLNTQIYLEAGTSRYYPYSSLASHVLGVVGTDGGLTGLEYQYDSFLKGESGKYITSRDAAGNQMPSKYDTYIDASNGANLVTTIKIPIQKALETQIEKAFLSAEPENRVTGIVMDCNTAAILGMATYPDFDLNQPYILDEYSAKKLDSLGLGEDTDEYSTKATELLYELWRNKAVTDLYEPGSTFKIISTAMALEENAVKLTDQFTCTGKLNVAGSLIHCNKRRGHGTMSFTVGLQQSCNPVIMTVAMRLGQEKFYNYFKEFGYTEPTGIDLPGEEHSIYSSYKNFGIVSLACYSFGQTFKMTPIRHLTSICSVANGGYLLTPHIVDKIVDDDGNILMQYTTEAKRQVVSTEVCKTVANILEEGVSGNGGSKNAYVAGYKVAAKTGTSEIRDRHDGDYYVGSCVAFAPSDNPQVAAIIIVDTPTKGSIYGAYNAAPYVSDLMEEILPYIGIERKYSEKELSKVKSTVRNYVGWSKDDSVTNIKNRGLSYVVYGNGNVVTYQTPTSGEALVKTDGTVYLYTGDSAPVANKKVPNLIGRTASAANKLLANAGFNVIIDGSTNASSVDAYVVEQSLPAGTLATEGTVVTVTVRYTDATD